MIGGGLIITSIIVMIYYTRRWRNIPI
jgi:hypothetical protein